MRFKALVKNKETKNYEVITYDYETKKAFMEDLRMNGYAVTAYKVKPEEVYDAIVEYTDSSVEAWKNCKTVEDAKNFQQIMEDKFEKMLNAALNIEEEEIEEQIIEELEENTIILSEKDSMVVINKDDLVYSVIISSRKHHEVETKIIGRKQLKEMIKAISGQYIRKKHDDIINYYVYNVKEV